MTTVIILTTMVFGDSHGLDTDVGLENSNSLSKTDLLSDFQPVRNDDESLVGKLSREAQLLTYGVGQGFAEQAYSAVDSENLGTTAVKFLSSVGVGIGMAYLSKGAGLRRAIGQAAGTTMGVAFLADVTSHTRLSALGDAMGQTWRSGAHFDRNLAVVKQELGPLAFDMTLMGAGGALGAYGMASGRFNAIGERFKNVVTEQARSLTSPFEFGGPRPAFAMAGAEPPMFARPRPAVMPNDNVLAMASDTGRGGIVPPYLRAEARAALAQPKLVRFENLAPELAEASKLANGIPGQDKVASVLQTLFTQRAKSPMRVDIVEIPPGTVGDRAFKTDAVFAVVQPNGQVTNAWPVDFSFAHKEFLPHVMKLDKNWFLYDSKSGALSGMINEKPVMDAVWARAMEFMKRPGTMQQFKKPVSIDWLQANRHDLHFSMRDSFPRLEL